MPESQGMDVYMDVCDALSRLVNSDVSPFLMSTAREADTRAACAAFVSFKDVAKAHLVTPRWPPRSRRLVASSVPLMAPPTSFRRPPTY